MRVPAQRPRTTPCKIAFLGEAPGQTEVERGGQYIRVAQEVWPDLPWVEGDNAANYQLARAHKLPPLPLVGPSGRVFNGMLRQAGIRRADCWVGNVFEEKAEGNDVEGWIQDERLWADALFRLAGELAQAQPSVVVPMDATALLAMTGSTNLARMRGSPTLGQLGGATYKLIPTYHPAYLLRQWKALPLVLGDLERAMREAEKGPELTYPWREFTLEPSLYDVHTWIYGREGGGLSDSRGNRFPALSYAPLLSVDIETGWGQITCIGFSPDGIHSLCVPFVDLRKPNRSYWATEEEETAAWLLVKEVMESPVPKVGQNFTYDAFWLLEKMGIKSMNYRHDTRLMHHALFAELPKDLASLASAYSEMPQWKEWSARREDKRDA